MKRRNPGTKSRATSTTPLAATESIAQDGYTAPTDALWQALFNGQFRLALRCDVCGRWLTETESKRAGRGPTCRARAEGVR
jgi:rubrerythrin